MREISPAEKMTVVEFLSASPPEIRALAEEFRCQKAEGRRRRPSASLIDRSEILRREERTTLLDQVAQLVDENLFGRSEMCIQFADLLGRALRHLHFPARAVLGTAIYYSNGREVFRWQHAWVRSAQEVVDGNVDVLDENPAVPASVRVSPYWGSVRETPRDRRLREDLSLSPPADRDVSDIWWPELRTWIDNRFPLDGP
jgi:hypothetical protein